MRLCTAPQRNLCKEKAQILATMLKSSYKIINLGNYKRDVRQLILKQAVPFLLVCTCESGAHQRPAQASCTASSQAPGRAPVSTSPRSGAGIAEAHHRTWLYTVSSRNTGWVVRFAWLASLPAEPSSRPYQCSYYFFKGKAG